jgi:hypothetical protein
MSEPEFFMPPIKRHRIQTRYGPVDSGYFKAVFYGPMTPYNRKTPWGWYQASKLVKSHKEALAAFREWATDTKAYINGQTTIY